MSLTNVLDLVKGLFSRAFWFGTFLPLLVFALANIALTAWVFPGSVLWEDWDSFGGEAYTRAAIALLALLVVSYAIAPLVTLFHGVLDGTLLPRPIHDFLRNQRTSEARLLRQTRREINGLYNDFDLMLLSSDVAEFGRAFLYDARRTGAASGNALDVTLVPQVETALAGLEQLLGGGTHLGVENVRNAAKELGALLRSAQPTEAVLGLLNRFVTLLKDGRQDAQYRRFAFQARHRGIDLDNPQATRIGDARALAESYPEEAYGVDFDYVWPRLQLVIPAESPLVDRILAAQGQLDFAGLSFTLTCVLSVSWLFIIGFYSFSFVALIIVASVAPLLVAFFYRLLFESQWAFGEVVKLAIDRHRLDLLTKVLRQPRPATLLAERRIWHKLTNAEQFGTGTDLTYDHRVADGHEA